MEKIIVNQEESDYINSKYVNFSQGGVILVCENDRVVGSVFQVSCCPDYPWVISTIHVNSSYENLTDIIDDFQTYTFKFITE